MFWLRDFVSGFRLPSFLAVAGVVLSFWLLLKSTALPIHSPLVAYQSRTVVFLSAGTRIGHLPWQAGSTGFPADVRLLRFAGLEVQAPGLCNLDRCAG
jgi:hypothetical protein